MATGHDPHVPHAPVDVTKVDHGHDDHGHGAHDDHGHGAHDDHGGGDAWVLPPLLVGLVIGIVIVVLLGLGSDVAPF